MASEQEGEDVKILSTLKLEVGVMKMVALDDSCIISGNGDRAGTRSQTSNR